MGSITQQVISKLQQADHEDELEESIGQAADLLFKVVSPHYISGRGDIDAEQITADEGQQIKQALIHLVQSGDDPMLQTSAFFALGKSYDPNLKELYATYLQTSLDQLKQQNSLVFQILIALDNIREDVFERDDQGHSSQGLLNVEKNVRQAEKYLSKHGIGVPW